MENLNDLTEFRESIRAAFAPHIGTVIGDIVCPELPPNAVLDEFIRTAFFASLELEERRVQQFGLSWLDGNSPQLSFLEVSEFELPVEFSVEAVKKLAGAKNPLLLILLSKSARMER